MGNVADIFIQNKNTMPLVNALAEYVQENDCCRMNRIFPNDRTNIVEYLKENRLSEAADALKEKPEAAKGFLNFHF